MNERRWWNGSWSRLTRRDVFVSNAADGRWQVELRRGGPDGRVRVRAFESEGEAVAWIEDAVVAAEANWREIVAAERGKAKARARRKVAKAGSSGGNGG